jgi:hypothetical protein
MSDGALEAGRAAQQLSPIRVPTVQNAKRATGGSDKGSTWTRTTPAAARWAQPPVEWQPAASRAECGPGLAGTGVDSVPDCVRAAPPRGLRTEDPGSRDS